MAGTVAPDVTDGPVLSVINKRLRALRKKYNRIIQMEESVSQGKALNKEQEDTLRSKPSVIAGIDELEKLKQPLAVALSEEITDALQRQRLDVPTPTTNSTIEEPTVTGEEEEEEPENPEKSDEEGENGSLTVVEDLLNLLYFGSMFDVKSQHDFTATMLTRTHERGCCLTYDYVTDDDAADLLGEGDLDLISMLGGPAEATRNLSQQNLNALVKVLPGLLGGSADLASSNMTLLKMYGDFQKNTPEERNVRFGFRKA